MAEHTPMPSSWADQEVNITYIAAGKTNDLDCTIREVDDWGVGAEREGKTSFFPWTSIVRIDRGHAHKQRKLKLR